MSEMAASSNGEVKADTPVVEEKTAEEKAAEEKAAADKLAAETAEKSAQTFSIKSPANAAHLDAESINKITEHLSKGKYVIDKYYEGLEKAHKILVEYYPQDFDKEFEASMECVKNFKETLQSEKLGLDDHTKLVFAQHLLTCNKSLHMLFEEPDDVEVKSQDCDLQEILKKAPKVSMNEINDMCQMSYQASRQKNKLIEELKVTKATMESVDSVLSTDLLKHGSEKERETWAFIMDNTSKLCELSAQLGPAEVITLMSCKKEVEKILQKMETCTKNWEAAGAHLEKKSPALSSLVLGPALGEDMGDPGEEAEHALPTRTAFHQALEEQRKKVEGGADVAEKFIKSSVSAADMESYNFVFNYLLQALCKGASKPLVMEEKVYLGYHYGKTKNIVRKISNLSFAKRVIEGSYVFKDPVVHRNRGVGYHGGYQGRPYSRPQHNRYGYGYYGY